MSLHLFKNIEARKITVLARIIKGPAGNPVSLKSNIPTEEDTEPILIAPKAY